MKNLYKIEDELYIVSSSEKIKENTQTFKQGLNGDWFYNTIYNFIARTGDITPYDFKIILTTNKLLIKEGVQAIDDEFLEWFVKNPSCEGVEIFIDTMGCVLENCNANPCINYKITIPKEEPKHFIECKCTNALQAENCIRNCGHGEEPEQETLEEAAEDYVKLNKLIQHLLLWDKLLISDYNYY